MHRTPRYVWMSYPSGADSRKEVAEAATTSATAATAGRRAGGGDSRGREKATPARCWQQQQHSWWRHGFWGRGWGGLFATKEERRGAARGISEGEEPTLAGTPHAQARWVPSIVCSLLLDVVSPSLFSLFVPFSSCSSSLSVLSASPPATCCLASCSACLALYVSRCLFCVSLSCPLSRVAAAPPPPSDSPLCVSLSLSVHSICMSFRFLSPPCCHLYAFLSPLLLLCPSVSLFLLLLFFGARELCVVPSVQHTNASACSSAPTGRRR